MRHKLEPLKKRLTKAQMNKRKEHIIHRQNTRTQRMTRQPEVISNIGAFDLFAKR